jgi:protein-S-isoprenylcysteine O-methyltransferase Ste14/NAD-dependent dihydropyrimidine dehydrogenase PreA subunit
VPIDPAFQKKREKVGKEDGIAIWGPIDPPEKLGIRGTYVAVDWDTCTGCGTCIEVCPMQLYDWKETPGHPTSERKPFPIRELDCVQCYTCETECPVQAIRVIFGGAPGWQKAVLSIMFAQIFVGIVYGTLFGPSLGLRIPLYVGWFVSVIGLPFFLATAIYFPKKGEPQEGKSSMDVTVVVDTGLYGIVRHPQYLGCISMMLASVLVSQHWLSAIIGVPIAVWIYTEIPKEERGLIIKFGDDYKRYMQRVPRMNFVVGVIRLLWRKKREIKVDG